MLELQLVLLGTGDCFILEEFEIERELGNFDGLRVETPAAVTAEIEKLRKE